VCSRSIIGESPEPFDLLVHLADLGRERVVQAQQPIDLAPLSRRQRRIRQPGAARTAVQIRSREQEVLRRQSAVNAILDLRALPHEEGATVQELAPPTRVPIGNPDRWKEIYPELLRQLPRVDRIGLRPCLPDELHLTSVGHPNAVM